MRIKTFIFTLVLLFSPLTALAGGGHDHGHGHSHGPAEITQSQAVTIATDRVAMLVSKGKIDESWKSVKAAKSEKKMYGGQAEWVVTYKNSKVSDSAKNTLYIFLNISGGYIAANFTGD